MVSIMAYLSVAPEQFGRSPTAPSASTRYSTWLAPDAEFFSLRRCSSNLVPNRLFARSSSVLRSTTVPRTTSTVWGWEVPVGWDEGASRRSPRAIQSMSPMGRVLTSASTPDMRSLARTWSAFLSLWSTRRMTRQSPYWSRVAASSSAPITARS